MRKVIVFVLILLFSTVAIAQNGGMNPVVAPDGTILVMRPGSGGTTPVPPALVAVSRTGNQVWTWAGSARMHAVAFDATQVFLVSAASAPVSSVGMHGGMNGGMMGGGRGMIRGGSDSIVALSLANGAERWRRELAGAVSGMQLSGDRLYVLVHAAGTATPRGGSASSASLVALDAATGTVIWTTSLQ